MAIHTYKCPKCNRQEDKITGVAFDDLHCGRCGTMMVKQFTPTRMIVLNRSKPGSFKFDPAEVDADKDMIHHFKCQEEAGKLNTPEAKEDAAYWYPKLKDKL